MDAVDAQQLQLAGCHIQGVYEDRLALDLHAVLALGCVVTPTPSARAKPLGEGFELRELQVSSDMLCCCCKAAACPCACQRTQ